MKVTEFHVEEAALAWLEAEGWSVLYGPEIAPGEPDFERTDYREAMLFERLHSAVQSLNPELKDETIQEAVRKLTNHEGSNLETRNRAFHRMIVEGVTVEYRRPEGEIRGYQAKIIDFDESTNNDFLAVNQFTVVENKIGRRPDIVLFVNGLSLAQWFSKDEDSEPACYLQLSGWGLPTEAGSW